MKEIIRKRELQKNRLIKEYYEKREAYYNQIDQ
jgi:predicted DNA-binding ribbon-helix-helix protein